MSRKDFPYLTTIAVAVIATAIVTWPLTLSAKDVLYVQQMYLLAIITTFGSVAAVLVGHRVYTRIRERRIRHLDEYKRPE